MASRNAFALLAEDGESPAPAPAPKPAAPAAPAAPASRGTQKTRGPASRGGKYYPRGGRPAPSGGATEGGADDAPAERKFENREGRGRGRGRGGPRGGRGGGQKFDRHSQTGRTDSDKKIHQGWGGDEATSELKAEETGEADASAEARAPEADGEVAPGTPAAEKNEGSRPRREREPEEEDNTLTLEQYLAQKQELTAVPKLETRQANEGADDKIWEGAVPLQKPEEDAYFAGKNKSSAPKSRGEKKEKVFIEIDARFERPSRGGRGGRGGFEGRGRGEGRGEGRGRGVRGGGRGRGGRANGAEAPAFSVDDETAFPSLS
ncbi:hypothetical protein BD626DRAFT_486826 [Schizophyllum amplum]|uniref:Hyaluronan/mRNA-binding protein domain-containing protein n=1 Tax=Schizophyllum amplum TaxID=97359 RepID=A0A550CMV8_9AGAR|nr:hypothetical protein BD626DRAFT_486826 [Auriculariopsis ampla]